MFRPGSEGRTESHRGARVQFGLLSYQPLTTWRSGRTSDFDFCGVFSAIIDQMNHLVELITSVDGDSDRIVTAIVLDGDVIKRVAIAVVQLEGWPRVRQAREKSQLVYIQPYS